MNDLAETITRKVIATALCFTMVLSIISIISFRVSAINNEILETDALTSGDGEVTIHDATGIRRRLAKPDADPIIGKPIA